MKEWFEPHIAPKARLGDVYAPLGLFVYAFLPNIL